MEFFRGNFKWYFLGALAASSVMVWFAVFEIEARRGKLTLDVMNVGQGDAIFAQAENGAQVLIDGGPDNSVLAKLGRVMPFWDRSIDLVILTHPHADHLDGLIDVLKRYEVDLVLETGVEHSIPEYGEWKELLKKKNVKVAVAKAGQRIKLSAAAYLDVLSPAGDFAGKSAGNVHDAMIVLKLSYGSTAALLMGDAEKPLEYRLLLSGANLKADILKVGHHGSKTSSTEEFLKAVSPQYAFVSAGRKNKYGHPHQEVLARFKSLGIRIFRTDEGGDIIIKGDGKTFEKIPRL